jgi:hypothetical protein
MHGFYAEQLRRYRGFLDAGQMRVLFFEDFTANPSRELRAACDFLGLKDLPALDPAAQHSNPARPPLHLGLRLFVNHVLGQRFSFPRPRPNLPNYQGPRAEDAQERRLRWYEKAALSLESKIPRRPPPPMSPPIRVHLQKVFAKENAGLSELLQTDVSARWPYMA